MSHKKPTLEETIGYTFRNRELYNQAVTHSSCFNEKREARRSDNEKLEFLGDAILNTVISIILYKRFRGRDEGFLSNARSSLVKRETLTAIAKEINLDRHMSYGNGEGGVPEESKVLSNMVEALIGALYSTAGSGNLKDHPQLFSAYFTEEKLTEKNPRISSGTLSQKKWGVLPGTNSPGRSGTALPSWSSSERSIGTGHREKQEGSGAERSPQPLEYLSEMEI